MVDFKQEAVRAVESSQSIGAAHAAWERSRVLFKSAAHKASG